MTNWPTDDAPDADPVDVAEQHTPAGVDVDDDVDTAEALSAVDEVGEANPVDVYEQAIPVGTGDDGWDRD